MNEENSQEKQHKPTEKHLSELKKKGQFLRSKDLTGGGILISGILMLIVTGPFYQQTISNNFKACFQAISTLSENNSSLYNNLVFNNLLFIFPFGIALILVTYILGFLFGGFGFSKELISFKAERLSPLKNLKRIFSLQNGFEVLKSIMKIIIFFGILSLFIYIYQRQILKLTDQHLDISFEILSTFLIWLLPGIGLIILIDLIYNYVTHQKKIMMSHQQIKEEQKESDGSPEVKRKIRQKQQSLSKYQIQQAVKTATVIITNPTHYAVALRYDETKDKAPRIMAKGIDHMAAEIRLAAIRNGVPIYEAAPLARAIYYTGQIGQFIHHDLYMAMAIVLSYIQQLKMYQSGLGQKPIMQELKIPDNLHFN